MKIKKGFVLRKFADKWIAVASDDIADEHNILITLNKTGVFVWNLLQNDIDYNTVIAKITEHYDIDEKIAKADFDIFLEKVRKAGIVDE
ncbi:MAG: PqqD family protein [Acutalibacteraceae bacterium]|nr:PqqD family protein [Acutalibacteraceae bacterium]